MADAPIISQTPASCSPGRISVRSGVRGRLRYRRGRLWHRHLAGPNLCSEVWIQRGQQPGRELIDGWTAFIGIDILYNRTFSPALGANRTGPEQQHWGDLPVLCHQLLHVSHHGSGEHRREDPGLV